MENKFKLIQHVNRLQVARNVKETQINKLYKTKAIKTHLAELPKTVEGRRLDHHVLHCWVHWEVQEITCQRIT